MAPPIFIDNTNVHVPELCCRFKKEIPALVYPVACVQSASIRLGPEINSVVAVYIQARVDTVFCSL